MTHPSTFTLTMSMPFYEKFLTAEDEELIKLTVRGNDQSYAELMRRYMRSVLEFISRYVERDVAERLTAETFYSFWKSLERLQTKKKFRRRLFSLAYKTIFNYYGSHDKFVSKPNYLGMITFLQISDGIRRILPSQETVKKLWQAGISAGIKTLEPFLHSPRLKSYMHHKQT